MSTTAEKDKSKNSVFYVSGMDCPDCAAKVENTISGLSGVEQVELNFNVGKIEVSHKTDEKLINKAITSHGYKVKDLKQEEDKRGSIFQIEGSRLVIISGLSLLLAVILNFAPGFYYFTEPLVYIGFPGMEQPFAIVHLVYLAAITTGGYPTFKRGFSALIKLSFDMNVLMTIAVIGAIAIGEWVEGAVIAFLFILSNTLETYSLDKTRDSIRSLMELTPNNATVKSEGGEKIKAVEDISVGEIIIVKPGEKIAMDGKVVNGNSWVNEAPITGESTLKGKSMGDGAFAGSVNQAGYLEIEVTKPAEENTLAKIIKLVEAAQENKAPTQKFIDRFAGVYTPIVLLLAFTLVTIPPFVLGEPFVPWLYRALALLLIACPCALVISTPVSLVSAMGSGAKKGILVKGGLYLEEAGKVKTIAFDKTGTLTVGKPQVTEVVALNPDYSEEDLVSIAASLEKKSEHPLAEAIYNYGLAQASQLPEAEHFEVFPGKGVSGIISGKTYFLGKREFVLANIDKSIDSSSVGDEMKKLELDGQTVIVLGREDELIGLIALEDEVRTDAKEALTKLKGLGVKDLIMLTGDNDLVAKKVANGLGINSFYAELLPEEKLSIVDKLMEEKQQVAMIGDGINDAPALAKANIGIAMGAAGTDTALETADVALMADDLSKLPLLIRLSRKTMEIIKQNIILALGLKLAAILLVFPGWLTLWMAVLADMGASLLVTANGLRLLKFK